jgi:hypothetical protein
MLPVNGFFEYGIAALLGGVGMIGLSIWALVTDGTRKYDDQDVRTEQKTEAPKDVLYKKAA